MIRTLDVDGRLPCQDRPELFGSPDDERKGSAPYLRRVSAARALCHRCPAMTTCRDLGRELREQGVWGSEDDTQRTQAGAKPKRRTMRFEQPPCGTPRGAQWHRRRGGGPPCAACLAAESNARRGREAAKKTRAPK